MNNRKRPNILITGTPGVGKSTLAEVLSENTKFTCISIGKLITEKKLSSDFDKEMDCWVLDEEKVCNEIEHLFENETGETGGIIVDYHICDFFPESWFDLIVVLRCWNDQLWPRLEGRGYSEQKIKENVEAEIMQVILENARESYSLDKIIELRSDSVEDMDVNIELLEKWISEWPNSQAPSIPNLSFVKI